MKIGDILSALKAAGPAAQKLLTPAAIMGGLELYSQYEQAKAKGPVSTATKVELGVQALALLEKQGVTLGDLGEIGTAVAPLVAPKQS